MDLNVTMSKGEAFKWLSGAIISIFALISGVYIDINGRLKTIELNMHTLEIKYAQHDKIITEIKVEMKADIKEIKGLITSIDKKLGITEVKLNNKNEKNN